MLDADNIPLKDPSYLFDSPQMKLHGDLFWQVGNNRCLGGRFSVNRLWTKKCDRISVNGAQQEGIGLVLGG